MSRCFCLIETAQGKSIEVINHLKTLKGVDSVNAVTGPYDVIMVANTKDLNDLSELVGVKVHEIPHVTRTVTCLSIADNTN
jgi:DNA-binding Lrp family transcriptional regulator